MVKSTMKTSKTQLSCSKEMAPLVPWLLDSDSECDEDDLPHESPASRLHQPWRAYWPPKSDRIWKLWLRSEYPEVLSWRFDHKLPFDRPWRIWTRTASAQRAQAANTISRLAGAEKGSITRGMLLQKAFPHRCSIMLRSPSLYDC